MKDNELLSAEQRLEKERKTGHTGALAAFALLFAGIEIRFTLELIRLVQVHSDRNYLMSAIAFQLVFIMSIFFLGRLWRHLGMEPAAALDRGKLLMDVFRVVLCLLLSLMFFSSVTADWARAQM